VLDKIDTPRLADELREVEGEKGKSKPYSMSGIQKIVQRMRKQLRIAAAFTPEACRTRRHDRTEEAGIGN